MESPAEFAELLYQGILTIQRNESHQKKKLIKDIVEELGYAIGRQASTIDHYRKGNTPTSVVELEQLARGVPDTGRRISWLERFVRTGGHPRPITACDELIASIPRPIDDRTPYLYKRTLWNVERKFTRTALVQTHRIELEVMSELGMDLAGHRYISETPDQVSDIQLQFVPGNRDGRGTMQQLMQRHIPNILEWAVEFTPSLEKGQKASYGYRQEYSRFRPWTYEECEELFNSKLIRRKFAYYRLNNNVQV